MKTTESFLQKTMIVWFGAFICCFLWGSAFPCIKIGYELFQIPAHDTSTQILFAGYRFTLAGILTIILGSLISKKLLLPKKESLPKIIKLCLLQTVAQYFFFYVGLAHTSGVKASIIEAMNVFVAIIIASLLFHQEHLSIRKMVGCIIGFAGVVLINLSGNGVDLNFSLLGEGFIFFSTVAYAFSSVCLKNYSKGENPVTLSGYQFVCGGVIMTVSGLLMGGNVTHFTAAAFGILVYLALVSAVAYSLWGILLKYNPVSRVSVFGFMNPVFGVILSAVFLGEAKQAIGITSLISLILVCVGIYIVNYAKR
ncbi:MAG: DMT family transporter [Hespellia sp.]|nr:DMT family transporter [Hespellia sp.]